MADSNNINIKINPNKMPGNKGANIDFKASYTVLDIEQVCKSLKERGDFKGNYEDLVLCVKSFLDETAYQLYDGYAVDMGYFSIHPPVG